MEYSEDEVKKLQDHHRKLQNFFCENNMTSEIACKAFISIMAEADNAYRKDSGDDTPTVLLSIRDFIDTVIMRIEEENKNKKEDLDG